MTSTKWGYEKNFNRRFFLIGKKIGTITLYSGKSYFKINFSGKNYRVGHNLLFECKENLRNNYF